MLVIEQFTSHSLRICFISDSSVIQCLLIFGMLTSSPCAFSILLDQRSAGYLYPTFRILLQAVSDIQYSIACLYSTSYWTPVNTGCLYPTFSILPVTCIRHSISYWIPVSDFYYPTGCHYQAFKVCLDTCICHSVSYACIRRSVYYCVPVCDIQYPIRYLYWMPVSDIQYSTR